MRGLLTGGAHRLLAAVLAVAAMGSGVFAYAASNTMPATPSLGDGAQTISGYTISGVSYTLKGSNAQDLDAVSFTISPASAGTVKVKLTSGGSWYPCTNTGGSVSCATTSPQASSSLTDGLTVVASQ